MTSAPQCLTVLAPILPGQEQRLRETLRAIGDDINGPRVAASARPHIAFVRSQRIHFARFAILKDRGRRLLFISDYDGSWESYIDEFAEMILSGLDAIWETSFGMPPHGARDLPAFKRFLRSHQVPADVFFAAYPDETVLNVAADRVQ